MATTTYEPIESKTLVSAATNITFTSIPQTYTDLIVVFNGSSDGTSQYFMQLGNGTLDTNSNYSTTLLDGNGSSAASARYSNDTVGIRADYYATGSGNMKTTIFQIQNYSNTTTYKTVLVRSSLPATEVVAAVGLWRSTSAVNTLKVYSNSGNFNAGAIVTLYGIANANIGAPKAQGGIITYDSQYFYHTFGASGTFTPQQSLTVDYLIVAGGAGGGNNSGGGGGAGGFYTSVSPTGGGGTAGTPATLSATGYSIVVGSGGAGGTSGDTRGSVGGNSTFNGITVYGGGGGGSGGTNTNGINGGAGGGSAYLGAIGTGTSNQGYNGGLYITDGSTYSMGGGGGGAGAVGQNAPSTGGGAGGIGLYNAITNARQIGELSSSNYYLAGGGGGAGHGESGRQGAGGGGIGGGGAGALGTGGLGTAGLVNTGGGGGSANNNGNSNGNGGSGIVIIRYLKA